VSATGARLPQLGSSFELVADAHCSRGAIKSQALYAASQGMTFPIIALVFYVGALWLISGKYNTAQFFTVLTSVVRTTLLPPSSKSHFSTD
jgi:hypothetical protein